MSSGWEQCCERRALYTFTRGRRGCVLERQGCSCNGDTCACGAGVHTLGSHVGELGQALRHISAQMPRHLCNHNAIR